MREIKVERKIFNFFSSYFFPFFILLFFCPFTSPVACAQNVSIYIALLSAKLKLKINK